MTVTTKRRKITERDHSIKTRLAKAKEHTKQPTVAEGKSTEPTTRKKGIGIMKLLRYEQETIVNHNPGEQTATLYTRDKAVMCIFDTLAADFPDTYSLMEQDEVSKTYSFLKSYVSYRKPRTVSAEQRERARQMIIRRNKEKEV